MKTTMTWRRGAVLALPLVLLATVFAGCSTDSGASPASEQASTAPASPTQSAEPTTLAFIADFGRCDDAQAEVATMVLGWEADAIATAGDNTYVEEGCEPFTESVGDYYGDYVTGPEGPRFWPALGNHDYENANAGLDAYRDYFSYLPDSADPEQRWYDMKVGGIHLFVLDNDAPAADLAAQQDWLESTSARVRAEEPDAWNIAVFHRPAHTSGIHPGFEPMSEAAGWDYTGWGIDVVVVGHQHIYEDVLVDGLHHVTVGEGANGSERPCPVEAERVEGSQVCIDGPGAMLVTSTPASLTLEWRMPGDGADVVKDTIDLTR
ncbi:MAG: metallophosphoesterase [Ornithinibacter sp.]